MRCVALLTLLVATPAFAEDPSPRISVMGNATVSTPPDRAQINFTVHGEGATSDEAVTALAAKRKAIEAGLARYAAKAELGASRVAVNEVRGAACNRPMYNAPKLSTGECAIIGYVADLQITLRTTAVSDAGTIVGLIGRLGGTNPVLDHFSLGSDGDAQRRATTAAIADARRQADALAAGAGVKLGELISVSNAGLVYQPAMADMIVTANMIAPPPPPPAPQAPAIPVDLHPRPIETQARVTMVYAIAR